MSRIGVKTTVFQLSIMLLIILSFLIQTPSASPFTETDTSKQNFFSIIQITDTQYLSAFYSGLFDNLTTWIVNNTQSSNLKLVIQTGDAVDDATSITQLTNANNSVGILLDADVPYCWNSGNHDQLGNGIGEGDPNNGWLGSKFLAFNGTNMRTKSYWVDDIFDSKNTAVQFVYDSYPFLVINLEFLANSSAIAWMEDLLNKSSGSNVIVATHDYLNGTAGYGTFKWKTNLKNILDRHPNVFLTLSGHDDSRFGASTTRVGDRQEVFFNRQSLDGRKGAAAARIYTFNTSSMQVSVRTFVTYNQTYLNDKYNEFNFNITLKRNELSNIFPYSYFWVSPNYQSHISFSQASSASQIVPMGSAWVFINLMLNEVASNLRVTTSDANLVINTCDPNGWINYTVTGNGTQIMYDLAKPPIAVYIDGTKDSSRWKYSNNSIIIIGASSSVAINFVKLTPTVASSNSPQLPATPQPTLIQTSPKANTPTPSPNSLTKNTSIPDTTIIQIPETTNSLFATPNADVTAKTTTSLQPKSSNMPLASPCAAEFTIYTIAGLISTSAVACIIGVSLNSKRKNKHK